MPQILQAPAGGAVTLGSSLSLTAAVVAATPVTFQWYLNGVAIPGATTATLSSQYLYTTSYAASQAGIYTVVATTAGAGGGSVTSPGATVTVQTSSGVTILTTPTITTNLASATAIYANGAVIPVNLGVAAVASLQLSYQWYLNGSAIAGATSADFGATAPGVYTVMVSTSAGSVLSQAATVNVTTSSGVPVVVAPTLVSQPQGGTLVYGSSHNPTNLTVGAVALLPLSYQWSLNGNVIPGATTSTYTASTAGSYTVTVTSSAGSVTSAPAMLAWANRLINISSRVTLSPTAPATIGFVLSSTTGASKQVLVRSIGPGLLAYGVASPIGHPSLTVYNAGGAVIATNTGWGNSPAVVAADSATGAFPLQTGSTDSALVLTLPPGAYTAQASSADGSTGNVLIETYEVTADNPRLINLSTLATVSSGTNGPIVGGFVTSGTQSSQVLVRAIGPALGTYGVTGTLAQPVLSIYNANGVLIGVNAGWSSNASANAVSIAAAATATGAFALQPGSADAALLLTLAPGAYTAQITGVNGTGGAALLEFYLAPSP
jgi:hypothetical protein